MECVPRSSLGGKPEIPPARVYRAFNDWHRRYSVENLEELQLREIESAKLEFENEVARLRTEYNPGSLLNPALSYIAGREPFTQEEFGEVRQIITREAAEIRMNFKRAKGRREDANRAHRWEGVSNVAGRIADKATNLTVSIDFPNLR